MNLLLKKYGLLIFATLLYFPCIFLGYGRDNDTYSLLDNAKLSLEKGTYIPSRHPGYIVHEAATMLLSSIGGSILSNAGTMLMTLLMIACFIKVCRYFLIPNSNLLAILLIIHPLIFVNSTETIDYLWALGMVFCGFVLLLNFHYFLAGLLFGLSIGARLSSFIAVGAILAYTLIAKKQNNTEDRKKVFITIIITAVMGILCYIPSLMYSNWTLDVFRPHMPDNEAWSFKSRLGKFIYKNLYLWGVPAFAVIIYALFVSFKNRTNFFKQQWLALSLLSLVIITSYEILFLKFPIQVEYLIPILPFSFFLIGIGLKNNPRLIVVLIIAVVSFNFINLNLAKANMPGHATGAKLGLWLEKGLLIDELRLRNIFKDCSTISCWEQGQLQSNINDNR